MSRSYSFLDSASLLLLRGCGLCLLFWLGICIAIIAAGASFSAQVTPGEFSFLPAATDSRQAERVFQQAFDKDLLRSLVIVNVRRPTREAGLTSSSEFEEQDRGTKSDFQFIENDLRPRLEEILRENLPQDSPSEGQASDNVSDQVTTFSDRLLGPLLVSDDRQASMVLVELPNDFLNERNSSIINEIERLIYQNPEFRPIIPPGLELSMSGTATVGRDLNTASIRSVRLVRMLSLAFLAILLLLMYRAPLLACIPFFSAIINAFVTLGILALLARFNYLGLFETLDAYVELVVYGVSVHFGLLLIARYREELGQGESYEDALLKAWLKSAPAVAICAATSILTMSMLIFADHGKFQQAGASLAIGLMIVFLSSMTLTPALLKGSGKWALWPNIPRERPAEFSGWLSNSSLMKRLLESDWLERIWKTMAIAVSLYPRKLWLSVAGGMLPFALLAVLVFNQLHYGLLSELPRQARSVTGTEAIQQHFSPGRLGPTNLLLVNSELNFLRAEQVEQIRQLSDELYAQRAQLGLEDIFSAAYPLGMTEEGLQKQASVEADLERGIPALRAAKQAAMRARTMQQYVGKKQPLAEHVARLDLVFNQDPFATQAVMHLKEVLQKLRHKLQETFPGQTSIYALGPTASIRDRQQVSGKDQWIVGGLMIVSLMLAMSFAFRQILLSAYIVFLMLFTFLTTLGMTNLLFWLANPTGFIGLDWKVGLLLWAILTAVGLHSIVPLLQRVVEERSRYSPIKAVLVSLRKTGVSLSCSGLIVAMIFGSLLAGSLTAMQQLGFALAFGLLLDTFIVRPIMIPAYLILQERGLLSPWSTPVDAAAKEASKSSI